MDPALDTQCLTKEMEYEGVVTGSDASRATDPKAEPQELNNYIQLNTILTTPVILYMLSPQELPGMDIPVSSMDTPPPGMYIPPPGMLMEPWQEAPLEIPPEDLETVEASLFSRLEGELGKSRATKEMEYEQAWRKQVEPEFMTQCPDLERFMQSQMVRDVYIVPEEWTGVNGFPLLELEFSDKMPEAMMPKSRPMAALLKEKAEPEFRRLCKYFFEPSTSNCASPIVVAKKASAPWVRICGDYRVINQYINIPKHYIPQVRHEIEKVKMHRYFCDLDCTNAFHQHALDSYTRQRLAVQTPWGLFQPKFLPEGVGPASGILQLRMVSIFEDYSEWMLVIFDNILVMADSYEQLFARLKLVVARCAERNCLLKITKSYFGVTVVNFFGYEVRQGEYGLSQERKDSVTAIPMPTDTKSMQRFLGAALYFKTFIPGYSHLTADLNDMVHKEFNWKPEAWTKDYKSAMARLKEAILSSATTHFPNYELDWVLRTDASDQACGGTLLQEYIHPTTKAKEMQVVAFTSMKFSGPATRWDIPKKEAYAIYRCVHDLAFYLTCKPFVIETDHANLVYIEKSDAAIIIRWRMYLQGYAFKIRHIPGKLNVFADYLSRMYMIQSEKQDAQDTGHQLLHISGELECTWEGLGCEHTSLTPLEWSVWLGLTDGDPAPSQRPSFEKQLADAHVMYSKHCGIRETKSNLNLLYPGNAIHSQLVQDYVHECPVCQKLRARVSPLDALVPITRTLKPNHPRGRVGVDTFYYSPPDKEGHVAIQVIVCHYTSFVGLYAVKDLTAKGLAQALFQFYITYGAYEELASDEGSAMTAQVIAELNAMFGVNHKFAMVNVHTASGVEGSNSLLLPHLQAICINKDFRDRWGSPQVMGLVQYLINDSICKETGIRRFDAMFGSYAGTYFRVPATLPPAERASEYIKSLNVDLERLKSIMAATHAKIRQQRSNEVTPDTQNKFLPGEMVLMKADPDKRGQATKAMLPFKGPYTVLSHVGNRVSIRHLASGVVFDRPVTELKYFWGTMENAVTAARWDYDQYVVKAFTAWRGDPTRKTTMEFEVLFEVETAPIWLPLTKDLEETQAFELYVRSIPCLYHLVFPQAQAGKDYIASIRRRTLRDYDVGETLYVDIRSYGTKGYDVDLIALVDRYHRQYMLAYTVVAVHPTYLVCQCDLLEELWNASRGPLCLNAYWCYCWGNVRTLDPVTMALVDVSFCYRHPSLVEPSRWASWRATHPPVDPDPPRPRKKKEA